MVGVGVGVVVDAGCVVVGFVTGDDVNLVVDVGDVDGFGVVVVTKL